MLIIHQPEIEKLNNSNVKLKIVFEEDNVRKEMWYSTAPEFAQYFCHERGDAFLLPLLIYAMKRNLPIKMQVPISERLYYTVTNYLTKALVHVFKEWHEVALDCPVSSDRLQNAGAVGTGLSCGIDSLSTVADHLSKPQAEGYRLTHCTFFNVGGHSPIWIDPERTKKLFQDRTARVRQCTDELGLPLVVVDSNIEEILGRPFAATSTFAIVSTVLALQKLFKTYYCSSGSFIDTFQFDQEFACDYDLFTLPMVTTETLEFFSSGTLYSRVEKTALVAAFPPSYRFLNVCLFTDANCSVCEKCLRTLITLDLLGKLHLYKDVFDIDLFKRNKSWYAGYVIVHKKPKGAYRAIYDAMLVKKEYNYLSLFYFTLAWYRQRFVNKIKRILGKEDSLKYF